jgi:hypothetical protein
MFVGFPLYFAGFVGLKKPEYAININTQPQKYLDGN